MQINKSELLEEIQLSESNDVFTIVGVPTNLSVFERVWDSMPCLVGTLSLEAKCHEVGIAGQKYMDSIYSTNLTSTWIVVQHLQ